MEFQETKVSWQKSFTEAIKSIENLISPKDDDEEHVKGFKVLAKWMMETECSPYDFMSNGYTAYKSNPYEAEYVLGLLQHALLDDGEVSFVKMMKEKEVIRVFMTFNCQYEENFKKICMDENQMLIGRMNSLIDSLNSVQEFLNKSNPQNNNVIKEKLTEKDFKFVAHHNPIKFIKEVEEFQKVQELKNKTVNEKLARFKP